jgi:hypothetical protein
LSKFKLCGGSLRIWCWAAGEEDVMAKLIEFYVPANFQLSNKQWTPEELRGKIINFPAGIVRKSA